jgi:hypothetical protein
MRPLFVRFTSQERHWQVALVDCPHYYSYADLADGLYSQFARQVEDIEILIIRPPVDTQIVDVRSETLNLRPVIERLPRVSLHLLHSTSFNLNLTPNLNDMSTESDPVTADETRFLGWLRQVELEEFVRQSAALFAAGDSFVYKSPSQRYCNMFLRVGNVQITRQALDAFFFWMLPYLQGCQAILTDTWSISSIGLNAARLLERYQSGNQLRCHVDMLSSYHDGSLELRPTTHEALLRVTEGGTSKVLVLISAVWTGNSLRRLRETIENERLAAERFSFLALYKLSKEPEITALCDLSDGIDGRHFGILEQPQGKAVIEIDPHAYFPLHMEETEIDIREKATASCLDFFTDYQGTTAFSVHRDAVDSNRQRHRHHGIYLDVGRMLATDRFQKKLRTELASIAVCPKMIIVPPHTYGQVLLDFVRSVVQERFGTLPQVIVHRDLNPDLPETPKEAFAGSNTNDLVLILDDVSVTGDRLSKYQMNLRRLNYRGRIHYLIGVARPLSAMAWKRRRGELAFRPDLRGEPHLVAALETVILPDWTEKDCPWCREQAMLRTVYEDRNSLRGSSSLIAQRLLELNRAANEQGLITNAIWRPRATARPVLTRDSIFLAYRNATDADVIACVAAALQQMRTWDDARLESTYPHTTVLGANNFFGNRFNDTILKLAIVRCAGRSELRRQKDRPDQELRRHVRRYLLGDNVDPEDRDATRLELAVAILARKLPVLNVSESDWEELNEVEYLEFLRYVAEGHG